MPEVPEEKPLETAPGESYSERDRLLAISAMSVAGCLTGVAACVLWLEAIRYGLPDARSIEYLTFLNLAIWGPSLGGVALKWGWSRFLQVPESINLWRAYWELQWLSLMVIVCGFTFLLYYSLS